MTYFYLNILDFDLEDYGGIYLEYDIDSIDVALSYINY